jgi:hypothetical protein
VHRSAAGPRLRDSRDVRIGVATFLHYSAITLEPAHIEWTQADPLVEIADQILEQQLDPQFVSVGDGIITFHCSNGDLSYGLREYDDLRETWLGVRSDVAIDDLLEESGDSQDVTDALE